LTEETLSSCNNEAPDAESCLDNLFDEATPCPVLEHRDLNSRRRIPFYDDGTVDTGSSFDLFDKVSWPTNKEITSSQYEIRMYLQEKRVKYGFDTLETEWWHFTLNDEPFPETYFDFDVE